MANANSKPAPAPAPASPAPAAASKAKPARYAETAVITVLVSANPKRAASAKRFAVYLAAPGGTLTVGAYLDACAALHPDEPRYRWRADLAWDIARGYISVA